MRTLFHNAQFWSSQQELFNAILIEDETICATGAAALTSTFDQAVDLAGALVIPAFIDGHAHPIFAGREAAGPKINGLNTIEEIKAQVKTFADANPSVTWIIGGAYEAAIIASGDFDAHWLDSVVSDRPVVLHAVDHHTIWVNSKALELAGITCETPDPIGGTIARRSDGAPKGTLREPSAMALILNIAPSDSIQSDVQAIQRACAAYLAAGVTCAIDSWVEKDMAQAYLAAARSAVLTIAMNLSFLVAPGQWRERVNELNELRAQFAALPNPHVVRANSIKFLADGALSAGTAALMEPYFDDSESTGIKIWDDEEFVAALVAFDALKFQVHIHAIGDAAVKQALDSIEAMMRVNPTWDRRPVIVHAQLICDEDLPRFKALGVIANIQPLWCYLDAMNKDLILPRIGQQRNDAQYRLRTLIDNGATIAFGSDWPVTSEIPLRAIGVPVNRLAPGIKDAAGWSTTQAITLAESLTFYTKNSAYQMFREHERGTLQVGMSADFIVLAKNIFELDPSEISSVAITALYQNGEKTTHTSTLVRGDSRQP